MKTVSPLTSAAVMITRPPEIVACLKIYTAKTEVYLIFDSHIRPNHPSGAGFILNTSMNTAAAYLASLFQMDRHSTDSDTLRQFQWQMDLMRHFSGHILVSTQSSGNERENTNLTLLESSMTILKLNAELAAMKSENMFLTMELEKSQIALVDEKNIRAQIHARASKPPLQSLRSLLPNANRRREKIASPGVAHRSQSRTTQKPVPDVENRDHMLALQLQWDIDNERASVERATREQQEYEMENRRLAIEREALALNYPKPFQCGICLEDHPEDSVARIGQCRHPFCRNCLREYIRSKLSEHIYPIFCPVCVAEQGVPQPSSVNEGIIRQLGFTEEEYRIFDELQISAYSILLHCRKCQQTMFVDREEHQESKLLVCPLPGCQHVWCKLCQQTIDTFESQHSCDGSSELSHLMKRSGWKYCPGCKTPIQKESGCNHMTCMAPGCNTHFCYRCGDSMVKSALQREVKAATSAHYQRCTLFEDVA